MNKPAFEGFGQVVTLEEGWRHARITGRLGFLHDAARSAAIREKAIDFGIVVNADDRRACADEFRKSRDLRSASALRDWLAARWMSEADFEALMELEALETRVRRAVVQDSVVGYFAKHCDELEEIEISRIRSADYGVVGEVRLMYLDGEAGFHALAARYSDDDPYARRGGYVGFVPIRALPDSLHEAARVAQAEDLFPLAHAADGSWLLVRCESRRPARLDASTKARIETTLFERWLRELEGQCKIHETDLG